MEWHEDEGKYVPIQLSDFERQRLENIAANERHLQALGLAKVTEREDGVLVMSAYEGADFRQEPV